MTMMMMMMMNVISFSRTNQPLYYPIAQSLFSCDQHDAIVIGHQSVLPLKCWYLMIGSRCYQAQIQSRMLQQKLVNV